MKIYWQRVHRWNDFHTWLQRTFQKPRHLPGSKENVTDIFISLSRLEENRQQGLDTHFAVVLGAVLVSRRKCLGSANALKLVRLTRWSKGPEFGQLGLVALLSTIRHGARRIDFGIQGFGLWLLVLSFTYCLGRGDHRRSWKGVLVDVSRVVGTRKMHRFKLTQRRRRGLGASDEDLSAIDVVLILLALRLARLAKGNAEWKQEPKLNMSWWFTSQTWWKLWKGISRSKKWATDSSNLMR